MSTKPVESSGGESLEFPGRGVAPPRSAVASPRGDGHRRSHRGGGRRLPFCLGGANAQPARGPIVIDTDVFGADIVPRVRPSALVPAGRGVGVEEVDFFGISVFAKSHGRACPHASVEFSKHVLVLQLRYRVEPSEIERHIAAIACLAEPTRRRLYLYVVSKDEGVGRDEAARAVGISRALAAFHLDRLLEDGLLVAGFRRLSGRTGPGAGRPAKLYWRSALGLGVSLPQKNYELAAGLFAQGPRGSWRYLPPGGLGCGSTQARQGSRQGCPPPGNASGRPDSSAGRGSWRPQRPRV